MAVREDAYLGIGQYFESPLRRFDVGLTDIKVIDVNATSLRRVGKWDKLTNGRLR